MPAPSARTCRARGGGGMGFWNPRVRCPKCGGKIPTFGFADYRTATSCQHCGVALTGETDWLNRPQLAAEEGDSPPVLGKRLDELERLAALYNSGALTDTWFYAEKARI